MANKIFSTLLLVALGALSSLAKVSEQQPNVLFILIDDFGWRDTGYNGSTFYETPEMDALSKQWARFDHCYTPSPMCSPTRLSILTGKNPARHGVTQWLSGTDKAFGKKGEEPRVYCPKPQSPGIKKEEITLGESFQEAGYETAFYGKWHMGKLKATGGPKAHGYDSTKAIIEENAARMFYPKGKNRYFPNAGKEECFTDLLTDSAIQFVSKDRNQPFYLHLCYFAMHAPIASKPELRKRFAEKASSLPSISPDRVLDTHGHKEQKLRQDSPEYAGELFNLDRNIGALVKALKEKDIYNNTIIVLTGDNGGRSAYFRSDPTSNRPLRTGKTFLFDGGIRTPLLIHWPKHSQPGRIIDTPVVSMDFYPTLLDMAGLPLNPEQHLDGVSIAPLFKNVRLSDRSFYFHFPHYQGEGSYPASAIRKGDYKLIRNYHHNDTLLYNIKNDPSESVDLSTSHPAKVTELRAELEGYLKKSGAYIPKVRN